MILKSDMVTQQKPTMQEWLWKWQRTEGGRMWRKVVESLRVLKKLQTRGNIEEAADEVLTD